MRDEEIHVGDVLRVREWNDMANEFTTDPDGDIWIPFDDFDDSSGIWFIRSMEYLCGKTFTVESITDMPSYYMYCSEEKIEFKNGFCYVITSEMLESLNEPINEPDFEVATDDEIKALFG